MARRFYPRPPDISVLAVAALLVLLAIALIIDAVDASFARLAYAIRNRGK